MCQAVCWILGIRLLKHCPFHVPVLVIAKCALSRTLISSVGRRPNLGRNPQKVYLSVSLWWDNCRSKKIVSYFNARGFYCVNPIQHIHSPPIFYLLSVQLSYVSQVGSVIRTSQNSPDPLVLGFLSQLTDLKKNIKDQNLKTFHTTNDYRNR